MKRIFLLIWLTLSTALVEVTAQQSTTAGQKYALIIGISNYPNFPAEHQLKYADQDAMQFKNFLQSPEGGAFPAVNIRLLTNADAKRDRIEGEIEWLSKRAHRDDTVYVFFSGHGMEDDNGIVYFMPYGSDYQRPGVGSLRSNYFLKDLSEKITSQHLIVFLDACHAAAATTNDGTAKGDPANVSAALKKTWEEAFKGQEASNLAFFSSSAGQRSWEDKEKHRGVFTWFLIEGLKGAADTNRDKVITAGELHLYLLNNVVEYTKKKFGREQRPLVSPRFNAQFPLAVLDIGDWYERGVAAYAQKAYTEALGLLTQAIRNNSRYSLAYFHRGLVNSVLGDKPGALADYTQAILLDPKGAAAYNNRGNVKSALGDKPGALADYTQAIALDPKDATAYTNRGNVKSAQGDKPGALADHTQAILLDPKYAIAYFNRGTVKSAQGDKPGALADYTQAIALDPKYADAYTNRGLVKSTLGDKPGALADYTQAARLGDKDVQLWLTQQGHSW